MAGSTGGYGPDFTALAAEYIDKNDYIRYWASEAKAPYLYNGNSFISYDDEQSLHHKCDYIKRSELAGMSFGSIAATRRTSCSMPFIKDSNSRKL